jgi:hypothetical protein
MSNGSITIKGKTWVIDKSIVHTDEGISIEEGAMKQDCVSEIRDENDNVIWKRGGTVE